MTKIYVGDVPYTTLHYILYFLFKGKRHGLNKLA